MDATMPHALGCSLLIAYEVQGCNRAVVTSFNLHMDFHWLIKKKKKKMFFFFLVH